MARIPQAPAGASGTVSKEEAGYRRGDPQGDSCQACMNFRPEMEQCSAVQGPISPAGLCDLFTPASEGRTPPGEPAMPPSEAGQQAALEQMLFGGM